MTMQEENLHAGGKWETINFLGVALAEFVCISFCVSLGLKISLWLTLGFILLTFLLIIKYNSTV